MAGVPEEKEVRRAEVDFRPMVLTDIPSVLTVEHASFPTPWTRQTFRNELMYNQFATYAVAVTKGRIIGYGGMWLILNEAHITNIAIHPDYRGLGIGESMMDYLMVLAQLSGVRKMTLEVRLSNVVAQNLYRKKGFDATGVRPGYYTDNQEDALVMWAELGGESDGKIVGSGD